RPSSARSVRMTIGCAGGRGVGIGATCALRLEPRRATERMIRMSIDGRSVGECYVSSPPIGRIMRRLLARLALGACAAVFARTPAKAQTQTAPLITLTRLPCGTNAAPTDVGIRFSDTYAYNGLMVQLTFSC